MKQSLDELLTEIRACTACKDLPLGPRPIVSASVNSRIVLAGQAPGTRVHKTGIPWNDPSGDRLREWLDMDKDIFYNEEYLAVVPMGFCYPGKGERGAVAGSWSKDWQKTVSVKWNLASGMCLGLRPRMQRDRNF